MRTVLKQFSRFTGVGMVSAIGHYGLLIALVQGLAVEPVRASVAGALLGAWINYALNYRYTFRSRQRHRDSLVKFAVVAALGLLLNTLLMWLGVAVLRVHYLISQLCSTGLVLLWSFSANRIWTFGADASVQPQERGVAGSLPDKEHGHPDLRHQRRSQGEGQQGGGTTPQAQAVRQAPGEE